MVESYVKLGIAALFPVALSVVLWLLSEKTAFGKLNGKIRQVIIGVLFGALAVVGTEWGIPIHGAQVNCRDAAVLSAGLLFGGPAGIIAGLIGGLERWFSVYWGIGSFTRVACTVSTMLAGVYAALLRKFMFENRKPGVLISLAIGVVMEVFHMLVIFFTNMDDMARVMAVEKAATLPMVLGNGISLMLSVLAVTLLSRESRRAEYRRVSSMVQRGLLITVLLAFLATSGLIIALQNAVANAQIDKLLTMALDETDRDISDASNGKILSLAKNVAKVTTETNVSEMAEKYDVAEICMVNTDGIITASSNPEYYTFDMASGEQSKEFLCLLGNTEEYVQEYGQISYNSNISRKYAGVKTDYGFLQISFDAVRLQQNLREQVSGITKNRHVGETGFILIFDDGMQVISAPEDLDRSLIQNGTDIEELPEADKTFTAKVAGNKCFYRIRNGEGYTLVSVLPEEEGLSNRDIVLFVNSFMEILVFALVFALIYLMIKNVVVRPVEKVGKSLDKITAGDLTEIVDVRSSEEFSLLSDGINSTVDTLKDYINDASEKIAAELEMAKNIQSSALPGVFPAFPKRKEFDIFAMMDPAKEVGGDFYDFYFTHENSLHFLIADVSGKGIPAAMFMMRALTELKSLTQAEMPLSEVFSRGNTALCAGNDAGMFVTAWQGGIDLQSGTVRYVNAGHNPPLVRHGNGEFEYLTARSGFILAGMEGMKYKENELALEPGDVLFLYTDGVTEATNKNNELYGPERLLACLNGTEVTDAKALCEAVRKDVEAFVGDAPQFDDITMVSFVYYGVPEAPSMTVEEATIEDIPKVAAFVEEELEKLGCPMKAQMQIDVAIDEIFSNIVKYAYAEKKGPVTVKVISKEEPKEVAIRFADEGWPYNPLTREDPDITLSAEERQIGGLGIFMVKKTMDDVRYKYENGQNVFTIYKRLE